MAECNDPRKWKSLKTSVQTMSTISGLRTLANRQRGAQWVHCVPLGILEVCQVCRVNQNIGANRVKCGVNHDRRARVQRGHLGNLGAWDQPGELGALIQTEGTASTDGVWINWHMMGNCRERTTNTMRFAGVS